MTSSKRRGLATLALSSLALLIGALGWTELDQRLRCAALFLRLEHSESPGFLVHYREWPVSERPLAFEGGRGRLYLPTGDADAPGVVLAHGMHEEGIDEPRLIGLARALAGAGFAVLTPAVEGLAHYQIVHSDVDLIAEAARALAREVHRPQVAVFGISFGGGLALRAACERKNRGSIAKVVALGAHNDAARVSRFYLGEPALGPLAEPARVQATPETPARTIEPHPYGRVALWMSLYGQKHTGAFTEAERVQVLRGVLQRSAELELASPRTCPEPLRVPLFLVHGTADRVVPYTETLWNARQFAGQTSVHTLISAAIAHAEYSPPSWWERLQLIEFMARALY